MEKIIKDKKFEKDLENAKKFNKFLRILKIIIFIALAIFLIHVIRNGIIITNLSNKAKKSYYSNNYHTKYYTDTKDTIGITEKYFKDGISLTKSYHSFKYEDKDNCSYLEYYNANTHEYDLFWDTPDTGDGVRKIEVKRYGEDADTSVAFAIMGAPSIDPYLFFIPDNATTEEKFVFYTNFLKSCIILNIRVAKFGATDCYSIKKENSIVYIDKTTGLTLREDCFGKYSSTTDCSYGFNFVTDEDVQNPELEGYILQED